MNGRGAHRLLTALAQSMTRRTGANRVFGFGREWTWYEAFMVTTYGPHESAWPAEGDWQDLAAALVWAGGVRPGWVRGYLSLAEAELPTAADVELREALAVVARWVGREVADAEGAVHQAEVMLAFGQRAWAARERQKAEAAG